MCGLFQSLAGCLEMRSAAQGKIDAAARRHRRSLRKPCPPTSWKRSPLLGPGCCRPEQSSAPTPDRRLAPQAQRLPARRAAASKALCRHLCACGAAFTDPAPLAPTRCALLFSLQPSWAAENPAKRWRRVCHSWRALRGSRDSCGAFTDRRALRRCDTSAGLGEPCWPALPSQSRRLGVKTREPQATGMSVAGAPFHLWHFGRQG